MERTHKEQAQCGGGLGESRVQGEAQREALGDVDPGTAGPDRRDAPQQTASTQAKELLAFKKPVAPAVTTLVEAEVVQKILVLVRARLQLEEVAMEWTTKSPYAARWFEALPRSD